MNSIAGSMIFGLAIIFGGFVLSAPKKQDAQKTQEQYQLEIDKLTAEIEKLRVEIVAQRKVLETVAKQGKKEPPKEDPELPRLIIFHYSNGGLAGKHDESWLKDSTLQHKGPGAEKLPLYNVPEEDQKELLALATALLMSNPKRIYGEAGPDIIQNGYTVSLVGKREGSVAWYKNGVKVPPELEKFDAKYQEIYARSKPIK